MWRIHLICYQSRIPSTKGWYQVGLILKAQTHASQRVEYTAHKTRNNQ
ncbi:unnamed protein product [Gulo gulo]|uniref:Uncharacterized protein n=1 Tax=Gulo gulo TaxID=48420 RepID=A0A9X9Q5R2_GULGU|nr:unnamed protein product [Gulo gulo]